MSHEPEEKISDEDVDKYFESGGEEKPEIEEDVNPEGEPEEDSKKASEKPEKPEKEKYVPYGALHEEREKRKVLQRQLEENAAKVARMEALWQRAQEAQQQSQIPSFDENPLEAMRYKAESIEQQQARINQYIHNDLENQRLRHAENEINQRYAHSAFEFQERTPDFKDAYQHFVQNSQKGFESLGNSPERAKQMVIENEMAIAIKAFQDGANPAERIYNFVLSNGYTPKNQKSTQKLSQINKGLGVSKTFEGGSGDPYAMSMEKLAQVSESDPETFDKGWERLRKIMRG